MMQPKGVLLAISFLASHFSPVAAQRYCAPTTITHTTCPKPSTKTVTETVSHYYPPPPPHHTKTVTETCTETYTPSQYRSTALAKSSSTSKKSTSQSTTCKDKTSSVGSSHSSSSSPTSNSSTESASSTSSVKSSSSSPSSSKSSTATSSSSSSTSSSRPNSTPTSSSTPTSTSTSTSTTTPTSTSTSSTATLTSTDTSTTTPPPTATSTSTTSTSSTTTSTTPIDTTCPTPPPSCVNPNFVSFFLQLQGTGTSNDGNYAVLGANPNGGSPVLEPASFVSNCHQAAVFSLNPTFGFLFACDQAGNILGEARVASFQPTGQDPLLFGTIGGGNNPACNINGGLLQCTYGEDLATGVDADGVVNLLAPGVTTDPVIQLQPIN